VQNGPPAAALGGAYLYRLTPVSWDAGPSPGRGLTLAPSDRHSYLFLFPGTSFFSLLSL
jgi:hypothetical protein